MYFCLDELLANANNCETSIKIMEERMQVLRELYQTYRGKLTRLERRHKNAMAKKSFFFIKIKFKIKN